MRHTRIDHAGHSVVPQILLHKRAWCIRVDGITKHPIEWMTAANARGLHAARCGKIGRPEAHAVHAWAGAGNLFDVLHAFRRFEQCVDENRARDVVSRFQQCEILVDKVDVPRPFDLGNHDDIDLVSGIAHNLVQIVEDPRTVQAIDAHPERGVAKIVGARHLDESASRCFFVVDGNCIFEIAAEHIGLRYHLRNARPDLLDVRRKEMDHALGANRQVAHGQRRTDGEGLVKIDRKLH